MLELTLSRNSPTNTIFSDAAGRPLYSATTPFSWLAGTTRISRFVNLRGYQPGSEDEARRTHEIARINWCYWGTPKLEYNGQLWDLDKFMPFSTAGLSRSFTGPDGKPYTWKSGWTDSQLEVKDDSEPPTVAARTQLKTPFKNSPPALVIEPAGMHMADLIVVTWVIFEKWRREQGVDKTRTDSADS